MIKDKLIPDAVDWFTGKALEEFEDEDDEYEDEDDGFYGEDDEEDDDDDDEEAGEGAAKPECKQQ
jgi:nucleosome assembly protein 1-like 1